MLIGCLFLVFTIFGNFNSLLGGHNDEHQCDLNDFQALDLVSLIWKEIHLNHQLPTSRLMSGVEYLGKLILFGGYCNSII